MQKIVTFNVGGQQYSTTESTINQPRGENTLLQMLLRRRVDEGDSIFIDRDRNMFRWVLEWLRSGILVDHTTVGVPREVWEAELQFYGVNPVEDDDLLLGDMEPQRKKLAQEENEIKAQVQDLTIAKLQKDEKDHFERKKHYARILTYMLGMREAFDTTGFEWVGPNIAYVGRMGDCDINPKWISYWFDREFKQYCQDLGVLVVKLESRDNSMKRNFDFPPASTVTPPLSVAAVAKGVSYIKLYVKHVGRVVTKRA
jgi:hypothetical protein